ncbi:MAG: hypothetical protein JSW55_01435 [Chloroflexota bacterium]|nr:MAG: hypothetical protein JSW55_01435 [Chloroflexota bacterium]
MRKYSLEEAIDIGYEVTRVTSAIVTAAVAFAIGVVLVKLLWAWTVPDLFPAAVDQGLVAADLTWLAATKVVVLVAILASTASLVAGRWRW